MICSQAGAAWSVPILDDSALASRRPPTEAIEFEGDRLIAVRLEDEVVIPMREICQALGLDTDTQSARPPLLIGVG